MEGKTSPIHPEMLPKLDPEFIQFYNATLADKPGLHEIPWNPVLREGPPIPGASEPLAVRRARYVTSRSPGRSLSDGVDNDSLTCSTDCRVSCLADAVCWP